MLGGMSEAGWKIISFKKISGKAFEKEFEEIQKSVDNAKHT